ncbi:hypothetical protein [uncultured Duncaniella sp.]|jgi:site-specific DNA-cytosine methylase|uniref:hypothetical protein n=1 Tax=uncultured Duncaniella sp. TaxID=2768039 RepID=UPI00267509F2|nr:hypothetical protein [uncultured Duncaniella sp.]
MKNVLIACEESQTVCKAFRKLGFNAYSCDILPCSGGHPEWHLHCDVLGVIRDKRGTLETGDEFVLDGEWDLMIAHPPCTYLSVSGARWYYHPEDKDLPIEQRRPHPNFPTRAQDRKEAIEFFLALANADIPRIAIENPVGIMSKLFHKPNQIVQPYWFGDEATKTTCLWLKNLPQLTPTKIVGKGERVVLSSGKSLPKWYSDSFNTKISTEMRRTLRSKTFQGFADAMAEQWSKLL